MITTNDLMTTLNILVNKEIDKSVIAQTLADVCNRSVEDFQDLIGVRVLRGYTSSGQRSIGVVSVGNTKVKIPLVFEDDKFIVSKQ